MNALEYANRASRKRGYEKKEENKLENINVNENEMMKIP